MDSNTDGLISMPRATRRTFVVRILAGIGLFFGLPENSLARTSRPEGDHQIDFDRALANLSRDEPNMSAMRGDREDRLEEAMAFPDGRAFTNYRSSTNKISARATSLIVKSEIGGAALYNRKYETPTWPGGKSGVTIGIGYDLGFSTVHDFREDWVDYLNAVDLEALSKCCGLTAGSARDAIPRVAHIVIAWEIAKKQFDVQVQPRCIGATETVLPNCSDLSTDSFGALVSLSFNRGVIGFDVPGKKDRSGRFSEMRRIKNLMDAKRFQDIPEAILSMRRIWQSDPGAHGLVLRREAEAALFSLGLEVPKVGETNSDISY